MHSREGGGGYPTSWSGTKWSSLLRSNSRRPTRKCGEAERSGADAAAEEARQIKFRVSKKKTLIIIGGGAAGFFLAANIEPEKYQIHILEMGSQVMSKIKISGGGRCNVTHDESQIPELIKRYPRGGKDLRNALYEFSPDDMRKWLSQQQVETKAEKDGRVFPASNSSQSIIDALYKKAMNNECTVTTQCVVEKIEKEAEGFCLQTSHGEFFGDIVAICTGSNSRMWKIVEQLGHKIEPPVPSLFSFSIVDCWLQELPGTSFPEASIRIVETGQKNAGPLLITHTGLSGPAVLVLSAWAARELAEKNYVFSIQINFLNQSSERVTALLNQLKSQFGGKEISSVGPEGITKKFWSRLCQEYLHKMNKKWSDCSKKEISLLVQKLCNMEVTVSGRAVNKDEFVTAGGVSRKEINWKTMESRFIPNLFLAGEVLDVDAVTGGFNFQACWSEAYILAKYLNLH